MKYCIMKSILDQFIPFNREMARLGSAMALELRGNYASAVENNSAGGIAAKLRGNSKKTFGVVDRVAAKFPRHGIYVEFGAGRGRGGSVGSSWISASGGKKTTNPDSLGKMNQGGRVAKPWLFGTIDKYQELIADEAAKQIADIGLDITLDSVPKTRVRR